MSGCISPKYHAFHAHSLLTSSIWDLRPIVAEAPISVIISAGKPLLEGPEKAPAMVNVTNANTTSLVYNMVTATLYLQLLPLAPGNVIVTVPAGTMTDSYVSSLQPARSLSLPL